MQKHKQSADRSSLSWFMAAMKILVILLVLLLNDVLSCLALRHYTFKVKYASYTRLCSTKSILTVNGKFPGPTIYVTKGETIVVDVHNRANESITIHWHGVNQPRHPWSDGTEFITQCPIQPGHKFSQKIIFSEEEGTLWWHAHNDYSRATVYGAIIIKPKPGTTYPFPKQHAEFPIILGEWWKQDINQVYNEFRKNGGNPALSDAYTINGQPGDLYPCSNSKTFKVKVQHGKTYLLRIINAAQEYTLFFAIAKHKLTVTGIDGSYTKAATVDFITISPGQTIDVLLTANQPLNRYYMAARAYSRNNTLQFNPTITTAILQYKGNYVPTSTIPSLPNSLPIPNDTIASTNLISQLRSLADDEHPIDVPLEISTRLFYTASVNLLPCEHGSTCTGPNQDRLSSSLNNISFQLPLRTNILEAYYKNVSGVYKDKFPDEPPLAFDYTANNLPSFLYTPSLDAEVKVLEYGSTVELVLQATNLLATEHPIHLHGHSFYVVGWGLGNFDKDKHPLKYNLVDPPRQNTVTAPKNGWVSVRFKAKNPGVWFMHCHLERHSIWGMAMTFVVKDGNNSGEQMLPPPSNMPRC